MTKSRLPSLAPFIHRTKLLTCFRFFELKLTNGGANYVHIAVSIREWGMVPHFTQKKKKKERKNGSTLAAVMLLSRTSLSGINWSGWHSAGRTSSVAFGLERQSELCGVAWESSTWEQYPVVLPNRGDASRSALHLHPPVSLSLPLSLLSSVIGLPISPTKYAYQS